MPLSVLIIVYYLITTVSLFTVYKTTVLPTQRGYGRFLAGIARFWFKVFLIFVNFDTFNACYLCDMDKLLIYININYWCLFCLYIRNDSRYK